MGCITSILFVLSIGIIIAFDIFLWSISSEYGISGFIAVIAFIIAYAVVEEVALAPRDFFWNNDWDIFCKKIGWAWKVALIFYALTFLISFFLENW